MEYISYKNKYEKKRLYIYIHCFVFIILQFYHYFIVQDDYNNYVRKISIIGILILIMCIYAWRKVTKQLFCPYIMFLLSFYMFQLGQCFLIALGIELKSTRIFGYFYEDEIINAQLFTIKSLLFLNIGALLAYSKNVKNYKLKYKQILSMKFIGWILFLISAPIAFYFSSIVAINSLRYGYVTAAYEMNLGQNALFNNLQSFFIPATIMLLISYNTNKNKRNLFFGLLVVYGFINLMIGTRTLFVSIMLVLFWYYVTIIKKINFRKFILITIVGYLTFSFMVTVGNYRGSTEKNFDEFLVLFGENIRDNLVIEIIEEFGGSMYPLLQVQRIIPQDEAFRLGESYLYATTAMVPNIGRILGERHIAMEKSLLDEWLMNYLNLSYGPGFSLVAEAYYNFGYFGYVVMLLLGIIIYKIIGYSNKIELSNQYKLFIVTTSIILIFTTPRRQFVDIFIQCFRYVLLPYVLILITNMIKK